jgi:hypothetical protein
MKSATFGNAPVGEACTSSGRVQDHRRGSVHASRDDREDVVANPLQERYAEVLLARIRSDKHPSATHMAMLESVASDRTLVEYILHLMERIEEDPNPSIPMMRRVQGLIANFGS